MTTLEEQAVANIQAMLGSLTGVAGAAASEVPQPEWKAPAHREVDAFDPEYDSLMAQTQDVAEPVAVVEPVEDIELEVLEEPEDETPEVLFGDHKGVIHQFILEGEGLVWLDRNGIDIDSGRQYRLTNDMLLKFTKTDKEQKAKEYNLLVAKSERDIDEVENPYPADAWAGTPYETFDNLCRGTEQNPNYIPSAYFINSLMTVVGAVCGHRVLPVFNQGLEARFITLLLSEKGGIGKNTIIQWARSPFEFFNLVYSTNSSAYKKIGCYVGDFGSARGMLEKFLEFPRILQQYGELSTAIEKFNIAGSGTAFRDQILNLADDQTPNWSSIKGMKVPLTAPRAIHNSLIAGTTEDRFEEMMAQSSWETLIQRMNIVPTKESRTVFKLVVPDLTPMQNALLPRISLLERYRLLWDLSPEAEKLGTEWYEKTQDSSTGSGEDIGRIQTYVFRMISHMALWFAPLPGVDSETQERINANGGVYLPEGENLEKVWNYEVPAWMMERAIRLAEYQIVARRETMPTRAATMFGQVENLIKKWVCKYLSMRWIELKRRSHIDRFGHKMCHDCLMNLQTSGILTVKKNPESELDQRDWVVVWAGSNGASQKWTEKRGGARKGTGPKKKCPV
jgi:hypothetical protein